jgi:hypothetical protein
MTPDPDGDEAESLRAHSEAICADYLNAVKLPGECPSLTVELIGPKNRGHVSARDIERAGHGLRIGVKIGDVAVFAETTAVFAETTGAGAPADPRGRLGEGHQRDRLARTLHPLGCRTGKVRAWSCQRAHAAIRASDVPFEDAELADQGVWSAQTGQPSWLWPRRHR